MTEPASADGGERQGQMEAILRAAGDAIITADDHGRIHQFNPAAEAMFGYSAEQMVGGRLNDLMPEPHASQHDEYLAHYEQTGESRVIGMGRELEAVRADGSRFPIELNVSDTGLEDPRLFIGIIRDITERKAAEQRLHEKTRQFGAVLEAAGDAVITADMGGIIHYFNPAAEAMFGYRAEQMVGGRLNDLMPEPYASEHDDYLARYEQTGEPRVIGIGRELEAVRADGSRFPIELNVSDTGLEDPRLFVGIIRDVTERKEAEAALEEIRKNLGEAQRIAAMGSWEMAIATNELWWSDQVYRLFGLEPGSLNPTYETYLEYVHPHDRATIRQRMTEALEGVPYALEHRVLRADGEQRWVFEQGEVVFGPDGQPASMRGTILDVTERKDLEQAVRHERDTAHGLINSLPGVFYMITPEPRLVLWNRNLSDVLGRDEAELTEMDPLAMVVPEMRAEVGAEIERVFTEGFGRVEAQLNAGDGSQPPYDLSAYRLDLEEGPCVVGLGIDVSQRVTLEQELRRLATTDGLTGLPNRRHFLELTEAEQQRAERYGTPYSLLMLDVDHFKTFNDTYGHDVGDLVLQTLAETVQGTLRSGEMVGRLGGEEFAILLPQTRVDDAMQAAERVRSSLAATRVASDEGPLAITVSIGVADWSGTKDTVESMLTRADEALYASKSAGRDRVTAG